MRKRIHIIAFLMLLFVMYGVSSAQTPLLTGSFAVDCEIKEMVRVRDHVYFACGNDGVLIYDFTSPAQPEKSGKIDLSDSYACAVATDGGSLFVSFYDRGVAVFDLRNPETPIHVRTIGVDAFVHFQKGGLDHAWR